MTLLTAFRECGPCIGGPDDLSRSAATEIVYEQLQELAKRLVPDGLRDEAVHVVVIRVFRVGPRGIRDRDPDSDRAVKGYLGQALKNVALDLRKAQARVVENEVELAVMPAEAEPTWPQEALETARRCLFDACVPGCAATLRSDARSGFERVIEDRLAMARGLAVDEIVVRDRGELTQTARNAIYQTHSRTLRRLGAYVENYIATNRLSNIDAEALRIVFSELCDIKD